MTMWEWNSNVLSVFFSFLLLCFEFEKKREPAEIVFIYLLFFQNINMVHKFFYTISLFSLDCLFSIFINLRV